MKRKYRGYTIQPKQDFGPEGYRDDKGRVHRSGFVVVDRHNCNVMPGGTWFSGVPEAMRAIDTLKAVRGCAEKFWERMQPFGYKVGDRVRGMVDMTASATVRKGRWTAEIRNGIVIEVTKIPWRIYLQKA